MSATMMTLPIDSEVEGWLATQAAALGVNIEQVAVETLRRQARKSSINEVFADVQEEFVVSGISEKELQQDVEQALAEVRGNGTVKQTGSPAQLQTFLQAMAAGAANVPVLPQEANDRAFYYEGQE